MNRHKIRFGGGPDGEWTGDAFIAMLADLDTNGNGQSAYRSIPGDEAMSDAWKLMKDSANIGPYTRFRRDWRLDLPGGASCYVRLVS